MKEVTISDNEINQRLDKFLIKYFNRANSSFVYKMLRKKNFKLNDKKAIGNEILKIGDKINLYLSDETHDKFHLEPTIKKVNYVEYSLSEPDIVYEDEHIMIVNKPFGLLSQSDSSGNMSLNDIIRDYILRKADDKEKYRAFKPTVCNRLDRNTGGLVICAKTFVAAQTVSYLIKKRQIRRFYSTVVLGYITGEHILEGSIVKDKSRNYVSYNKKSLTDDLSLQVKLRYRSVKANSKYSMLEVELITGKSHQIRVQMAAINHPVLGDNKYGNRKRNSELKVKGQLLYAYKLMFPKTDELCLRLVSGKSVSIELPQEFNKFFD